jgi:hypothetical protein
MKKKAKAQQPKTQEIPRFRVTVAKLCQGLAYFCLLLGVLALICTITGLIITYWPQSEPSINSAASDDTAAADFGLLSWVGLILRLSTGAMIFIEIVVGILALLVIIWGVRFAVRTMRRWTWRLADELIKPLALVEPILLLVLWALTIIGAWFLLDDQLFVVLSLICLVFLLIGLVSLLGMRKLVRSYLDFTRGDLVLHRR